MLKFSPKKAIQEFQEAYLRDFHQEISEIEAQKMGGELLQLFQIIYKPIKKQPP